MPTFKVAFNWSGGRVGRERRIVAIDAQTSYLALKAYVDHVGESEVIGRAIGKGVNAIAFEVGKPASAERLCHWCDAPAIAGSYHAQFCEAHRLGPHTPGMVRP
jgi:hypothetical protein